MTAIACIDKSNGIGKNGKLLISIPDDMNFFRETTKDSIVIMGRKTLFSLKNRMPLNNRINIVFTNNDSLKSEYINVDNIFFIKTIDELNDTLEKYTDKKVFVIGGASIYEKLICFCDTCLITKLDKSFDADTFFPDLKKNGFTLIKKSEIHNFNNINYQFQTYRRI